ncbi:MAG: aminotransferase class V-fold PLP-dependent enzyme [Chloroherpetonaceae bacterium]|nr:aminotransferase class V-fold PLP-dependent enzyme [Chloroherpetonaceae bacterium]MCS7211318.1 aminotransferase class V-fold PLP-dependent enzyme [Chloroherpetonaceae bacterium]
MNLTNDATCRKNQLFWRTESYRSIFPHLHHQLYLNHAAVSPLSLRVRQAIEAYLAECSEFDVENYWTRLLPTLESARQRVAAFIHAEPRNVAFVPNTSYGLNILAQGLRWKSGDRILLYDKDFPSNVYPFLNLRKHGVEIDFVSARDGQILLEDIAAKLTPRTRLVSMSYVQFLTGYRLDLAELAELCHQKGALVSIDAIQALGAMPIDFLGSGIDFLAAGAHKWAMSPMGIGIMVMTDALMADLQTPFVGWLSVKDGWNFFNYEQELLDDARRYELGTQNWMGLVGLNEAFAIFHELGAETIAEKLLTLSEYLCERLYEEGFEPAFSAARKHYSGIVSIQGLDNPSEIQKRLLSAQIEVSTREGLLRISPHFYNSIEDLEQFLAALKKFAQPRLKPV